MAAPAKRPLGLSWARSVKMALKGLRVEFRRSLLTGISVALALAFLSFVWTNADVLDALRRAADDEPALARRLMIAGRMNPSESSRQRSVVVVAMSLIVCTVGISNAMAMAVTERFGQIGTMKCLGALNMFIARLYLLEAVFLGLVGTLIGDFTGMLLAVVSGLFQYGVVVIAQLPWPALAAIAGYTVLVGIGISLLGALYPAIVAARMQPVEAMRVTG